METYQVSKWGFWGITTIAGGMITGFVLWANSMNASVVLLKQEMAAANVKIDIMMGQLNNNLKATQEVISLRADIDSLRKQIEVNSMNCREMDRRLIKLEK